MANDNLKRLAGRIEALKGASMFNAKPLADAALDQAMICMAEMNERLERLENGKA